MHIRFVRPLRSALAVLLSAALIAACGSSHNTTSSPTSRPATSGSGTSGSVASGPALTKSTYTIGSIASETQPPISNKDADNTLTAWEKWVNTHGGINGHPVKVIMFDDQGSPAKATSAFQTLKADHVLAIIDGSMQDPAWASAAAAAKIPVLCGLEVADGFTCSTNPYFFPAGGTVLPEIYGDFTAAKRAGAKVVGMLPCSEIAACTQAMPVAKQDVEANGLKWTDPITASQSAPSFTAQCEVESGKKVDGLFPFGTPSTKVADDCARQGYHPTYIEASGTWTNSLLQSPNLNGAVGTVSNVPWVINNTPATKVFHQAEDKVLKDSYSPYNVITEWAAGLLFEAAAAQAGDNPTPADIEDGLYSLHNNTLGGFAPPLTFTRGKGHNVPYFYFLSIKDGKFAAPFGTTTGSPTKLNQFGIQIDVQS